MATTGARFSRARDELRRALLGGTLVGLFAGCAGGDEEPTTGFSGFASNPSATNPSGQSAGTADGSSGGEGTGSGSSTSSVDPSSGGTTGEATTAPVTTGPATTGPMTTGPATTGDDSTTTTTTGDDSTTTTSTTGPDSTATTEEPPPPPPPKDPQPANGVYADCSGNKTCDMNLSDGCFELQDADMMKLDGYCTLLCGADGDCLPKPNAPAAAKCVNIGNNQKVCMLSCTGVIDCPTGMSCESVNINGQPAKYCW